jgi:hypothetical protein
VENPQTILNYSLILMTHLIMIDELLQGDELPLSYAVHAALHVNSEVLVAARRF